MRNSVVDEIDESMKRGPRMTMHGMNGSWGEKIQWSNNAERTKVRPRRRRRLG